MRFAGEFLTQGGPDFGGMSQNTLEYRGKEKVATHQAESQTHQYGLKSIADIRAAEAQAEATVAQGQAAGQAAMFDGLMSGISGIASAGIQQWGAPKSSLPKLGTPERGAADMKTLGNMGSSGWADIAKGLVP